ncbi:MBOAT family protein [Lacinutrix iliipiscaria]|uniref:MBOAT family protein n=1 Tax=Lacinutrix iliipiscaria TaxID=1230532 RepID=A0ABW5WMW2_9FLAO
MLFNSIEYLIFLPTVFILYWLLKGDFKKQNMLLLIASFIFYGWWDWRFLGLIVYSSYLDYFIGLKLHAETSDKIRKRWLTFSLVSNLGLLGFFKYYNFFTDSFAASMQLVGWEVDDLTLNIILPVGISFYTFQTLSYTIDIYRKEIEPTKDIVAFFTFVSFFPQLVAGPIERASHLIPQIEKKRVFKEKWFKDGLFQIAIGLFRKIVIADNLAIYVDSIYGDPEIHNSSTLLLATIFYSWQIYFDFTGYSDIAIGSAKLLGFEFNQNFNMPYFANSVWKSWRRWHISLSSWLRDYLFISLGGSKGSTLFTFRNLMLTMVLAGLWHGSSWSFVIWGAFHGFILILDRFLLAVFKRKDFGKIGYLYPYLIVLISWPLFRAQNLSEAVFIMKKMLFFDFKMPFIGDSNTVTTGILMLAIGFCFDLYLFNSKKEAPLEEIGSTFSTKNYSIIMTVIILLSTLFYSTSTNFIYFQF